MSLADPRATLEATNLVNISRCLWNAWRAGSRMKTTSEKTASMDKTMAPSNIIMVRGDRTSKKRDKREPSHFFDFLEGALSKLVLISTHALSGELGAVL